MNVCHYFRETINFAGITYEISKKMSTSKVYFSDLRTSPTSNLLDKMERLLRRAGIGNLPLDGCFTAIKIHFGEPGNLAYIRPNYAARMATLLRSLGAKPFLTDCNTLYSGRRSNAVDHLESAMENGFNPMSARCQVIIGDGLKGTDYREVPIEGTWAWAVPASAANWNCMPRRNPRLCRKTASDATSV